MSPRLALVPTLVLVAGFVAAEDAPVTATPIVTPTTPTGEERLTITGEQADEYRATTAPTATRTDVPLMQTPVSIQVITADLLRDQNVRNLEDAMKNVSGVYGSMGPDGNTMDTFLIRGFEVDFYGSSYLDGVKDFSRSPKEIATLERVEVLKGPAAIMYGRIEPGGMVNRVTKRPLDVQRTTVEQQLGSFSTFRTVVDSTGPASEEVLYRVVAVYEDGDGYKDFTHNRRLFVAPQVTWLMGDVTQVTVGLDYLEDDRSWALTYGTTGDANGPVRIPISTNLHDKDDRYSEDSVAYKADFSHRFSADWELRSRVTFVDRESVAKGSGISDVDAAGDYTRSYWGWEGEDSQTVAGNIDLVGRLHTGPLKHTLVFGVDAYYENYDSGGWAYGGTDVVSNIHRPVYDAPYDSDYTVDDYGYRNHHWGLYAQDQVSLFDDRLHVLAGVRYDDAYNKVWYAGSGGEAEDQVFTWRAGVLYQIRPELSVFASYTEGFGAPQLDWSTGGQFDTQTSHQYEGGVKWQMDERFGGTLTAFQLTKDNLTRSDPMDPTNTILAGEAQSQGIEVDLTGRVTDDLRVVVTYAYTDTEWTNSEWYQGESFVGIPEHAASIWGTYTFGGSGWRTGAGAVWRDKRPGVYRGDYPALYDAYELDAYIVVDLMVAKDFRVQGLDGTCQLNVGNLFDEFYHPTTYGGSTDRIELGAPRTVTGSVSLTF